MGVEFTRKKFLEVWRGDEFISRHVSILEAGESASEHADAFKQSGVYQIKIGTETYYEINVTFILGSAATIEEVAVPGPPPQTGLVFPHLGTYQIGNWANAGLASLPGGLTGRAQRIAKHDIAIIGIWKQWTNSDAAMDASELALFVKSFNSAIKLYSYVINVEVNDSSNLDQWVKTRNKADSESNGPGDWWLRDAAGNKTSTFAGADRLNHSDLVDLDSHSWTFAEWNARLFYFDKGDNPGEDYDALGFGWKIEYGWDGIYFDVMDWDARVTADWNEDGVDDPKEDFLASEAMSTGHIDGIDAWKSIDSAFIFAGNYAINTQDGEIGSVQTRLFDAVNGPLYEHAMGRSFSQETFGGTEAFLKDLKNLMTFSTGLDPRHEFVDCNIQIIPATHSESDWTRYGLCMVLQDDAFFGMRKGPSQSDDCVVINEYDINMGQALDAPNYAATASGYLTFQNGCYLRRFDNHLALLNPKDNGDQTITLPVEPGIQYDRLGAADFNDPVEDADVNDGATNITTQFIKEREGIIIKRVPV